MYSGKSAVLLVLSAVNVAVGLAAPFAPGA